MSSLSIYFQCILFFFSGNMEFLAIYCIARNSIWIVLCSRARINLWNKIYLQFSTFTWTVSSTYSKCIIFLHLANFKFYLWHKILNRNYFHEIVTVNKFLSVKIEMHDRKPFTHIKLTSSAMYPNIFSKHDTKKLFLCSFYVFSHNNSF